MRRTLATTLVLLVAGALAVLATGASSGGGGCHSDIKADRRHLPRLFARDPDGQ